MTRDQIDRLAEAQVYAAAYAAHRHDSDPSRGRPPVSPHEGARAAVRGYREWRALDDEARRDGVGERS